jgi:hypothetical protein
MVESGCPLVTQSDYGMENTNIAYAHTTIRQFLDPNLPQGRIQHNWMRGHRNIKPEAAWSRFRCTWSPGFENMLQQGLDEQLYNPDIMIDRYIHFYPSVYCHCSANTQMLDSLVFRWIAIPYIQREIDPYVHLHNTTRR